MTQIHEYDKRADRHHRNSKRDQVDPLMDAINRRAQGMTGGTLSID